MAASPHTFHIPVMGLAYTIDTPVKVARYGIDSVISIIEDKLVELMRKHYYDKLQLPFQPISSKENDYRAKRITDYLNLVNRIIKRQMEELKNSPFVEGSEIAKYFEMLPSDNILHQAYQRMKSTANEDERTSFECYLRDQIQPGRIDVNIMTKVDKENYDKEGNILTESSDALAALRGYAMSDLTNSSIVFSAGLNPRLFNYLEKLSAFNATAPGHFEKKIIIKVSDYRSALIQGKYLAKKGIWVSEFRIESGLNCGGHAFATDGSLLGPILDEFKTKKSELTDSLHQLYNPAIEAKGFPVYDQPHPIDITVQGGIGTYEEAAFLFSHYAVKSAGWGTPFLLCPEATTVDDHTLQLLSAAKEKDIELSKNSPLGVRFNYLKGTTSEKEKLARIAGGKPGSPCTEKHLVSNTEFTKEPICTASHAYQKRKIEQLKQSNLSDHEYEKQYQDVVSKECLCIGLSNAAILKNGLPPIKRLEAVTICPGPNIAYFDKVVSLKEIIDHIYGRTSLLTNTDRPHMFIKELFLNINYLKERMDEIKETNDKVRKDLVTFCHNLLKGITYYQDLSESIARQAENIFRQQLQRCEMEVESFLKRMELRLKLEV